MKKILIIEDDATLREELRLLLENGGYAPCVTTDFENAADEAARIRPDLVLLDILLPDANGQSILRDIRSGSDVPVIMLTSRSTDADEIISRSSGADDYVTKPYNPALLLLRIESHTDPLLAAAARRKDSPANGKRKAAWSRFPW